MAASLLLHPGRHHRQYDLRRLLLRTRGWLCQPTPDTSQARDSTTDRCTLPPARPAVETVSTSTEAAAGSPRTRSMGPITGSIPSSRRRGRDIPDGHHQFACGQRDRRLHGLGDLCDLQRSAPVGNRGHDTDGTSRSRLGVARLQQRDEHGHVHTRGTARGPDHLHRQCQWRQGPRQQRHDESLLDLHDRRSAPLHRRQRRDRDRGELRHRQRRLQRDSVRPEPRP